MLDKYNYASRVLGNISTLDVDKELEILKELDEDYSYEYLTELSCKLNSNLQFTSIENAIDVLTYLGRYNINFNEVKFINGINILEELTPNRLSFRDNLNVNYKTVNYNIDLKTNSIYKNDELFLKVLADFIETDLFCAISSLVFHVDMEFNKNLIEVATKYLGVTDDSGCKISKDFYYNNHYEFCNDNYLVVVLDNETIIIDGMFKKIYTLPPSLSFISLKYLKIIISYLDKYNSVNIDKPKTKIVRSLSFD